MQHVAVDIGSKQSQVCVRGSTGEILRETQVETRSVVKLLQSMPPSRIILETCSEAFAIANQAKAIGHEIRVVPATLAPALGVGERGVKTDKRDARNLSMASCRVELVGVHVPSTVARELRSLCTSREALVNARTKLINTVRGWARTQLTRIRSGKVTTFPQRAKLSAEEQPTGLPIHIERVLKVIGALTEQIQEADAELKGLVEGDAICLRLMTVPGIGPVSAARFRAAIDDVKRFPAAHRVASYLGLTPGENSSGERKQRKGVTGAGPSPVRRTLVQAAWTAIRTRPKDPMVRWALTIAERSNKQIAAVALSRKMAKILFAIWRDETTYEPARGATSGV